MSEITDFYDELSEQYHLIFADWDEAVERQGELVDRVIRDLAGPGAKRVLDAACGIGEPISIYRRKLFSSTERGLSCLSV